MKTMDIKILCDRTDCIWNKEISTPKYFNVDSIRYYHKCINPQPAFLPQSDQAICTSYTTKEQKKYLDKINHIHKTTKKESKKLKEESKISPYYAESCRYPNTFRIWGCSTCDLELQKYCWDREIYDRHRG
jgi:hypothetical protein